jgi:Uma2 family endonuclease
MSTYPVPRLFTFREYLKIERAAVEKSEFLDGQIFAMAGGTVNHNRIALNVAAELRERLRGTECKAVTSDTRIVMSKSGPSFYPDVSVYWGPPIHLDSRRDSLLNPTLIVEVLSNSTAGYDRRVKIPRYRRIPSVESILLISQEEVTVEHLYRNPSGEWLKEVFTSLADEVDLSRACGARIGVADIYEEIEF